MLVHRRALYRPQTQTEKKLSMPKPQRTIVRNRESVKKKIIKQFMNHMMAWQHSCLEWQAEEQTLIEEHLLLQMHSLKVKSGLLKLMDLLTHVKTTG